MENTVWKRLLLTIPPSPGFLLSLQLLRKGLQLLQKNCSFFRSKRRSNLEKVTKQISCSILKKLQQVSAASSDQENISPC
jgi:hypothetical protein